MVNNHIIDILVIAKRKKSRQVRIISGQKELSHSLPMGKLKSRALLPHLYISIMVGRTHFLNVGLTGLQLKNPCSSHNYFGMTLRKYVFDVTAVGCNSVKVEIKFHLKHKLHFPSAQLMLRQMHLTNVSESINFLGKVLTFNKCEYEL